MATSEIKLEAVKPEKALEYWKTRKPLTAEEKRELEQGARDRAMTVAGLARHQQLATVHAALEKALAEGTTLADFKKGIRQVFGKQGASNWRMENIFRTNLAAAYSAGAWAEIQATKNAFPFLEYLAVGDERTRPSHKVLHGLIFPVDHEFWQRNYPPNGFACRCTTAPVSKWRAKSKGLKIETEMPSNLVYQGPGGYPIPVAAPGADPGFVGNVGRDWLSGLTPRELDRALTFGPARTVCPVGGNFANAPGPCGLPLDKIDQRHILPVKPGDILPAGQSDEYYAMEFLKAFGINNFSGTALLKVPGVGMRLPVNRYLLTDKVTGLLKANKNGRGPYMRLLAETIKNPFEVWQVPAKIARKPWTVLRLIRLFGDAGGEKIGGFSVFNWAPGQGWSGATAFTPKIGGSQADLFQYLELQRAGILVHREK